MKQNWSEGPECDGHWVNVHRFGRRDMNRGGVDDKVGVGGDRCSGYKINGCQMDGDEVRCNTLKMFSLYLQDFCGFFH